MKENIDPNRVFCTERHMISATVLLLKCPADSRDGIVKSPKTYLIENIYNKEN
jgi:hypothetical protein